MSLRVWLPLTNNYDNYGLSDLSFVDFSNIRHIRFVINATRGTTDSYTQLSRLEFLDESGNIFPYSSGTTVTTSMSGYAASEPPASIVDGNVNTKFCCPWSAGHYLTINLDSSQTIDINKYSRFQWYTANDGDWRDPVSFTLQFSSDGVNFATGAIVTNASITTTRFALGYIGRCFSAASGKISQSCYYNNSYNSGGLTSNKKINLGNQLSMCCWVKFNALTPDSALGGSMGGQHRYPTNTGMGLTLKYVSSTTGYLSCNTGDGSSRTYNTYCGNTLLYANTWYHVCFTYDGSTIKLYVNGQLDGTYSYSSQLNIDDYIIVGAWSLEGASGNAVYSNYKLHGYMNDFRIYDHVLSKKEIKLLSQGLVAHYQLKGNGRTNYLKGAETYTKDNPLIRKASVNIGNIGDAYIYHDTSDLSVTVPVDSVYTWVFESDAIPSSHQTSGTAGSERRLSMWLQNTSTSNHYCWTNYGTGPTGEHYGSVTIPAGTYRVRTNLYAADGADYTVKLWNMKLIQGPYDLNDNWCPGIEDKTYNTMGFGVSTESDCSGYGNNAIKNTNFTVDIDSPRYGQCYVFSGSSYLACGRGAMLTDGFTLSLWARADNWSTFNGCFISCTEGGGWGLGYQANTDGHGFEIYLGGSYYGINLNYNNLSPGWHHIVATWNKNTIVGYIDGEERARKSVSGAISYHANNGIFIGQEAASNVTTPSGYPYYGKMSDVRIYATALSATDVADLFNNAASLSKEGILTAYSLHENKRNSIDKTGVIATGSFGTQQTPLYDMKITALGDNSTWARIHHLDVTDDKSWFSRDEVEKCLTKHNRYSRMEIGDKYKTSANEYEFMLTYPSMKKTIPAGYTQLDYIEATGTQWVNTGVSGAARWEFDIEFESSPLIPTMTSNTAPSGQASCWNGHNSGQEWRAYYTFDGNHGTMGDVWYGIGYGLTTQVGYLFPSPQAQVEKIKICAYVDGGGTLESGVIEYTTDGSTWNTLISLTSKNFVNNEELYFDVDTKNLLGIRAGAISTSNGLGIIIRELQVYGTGGRRQLMGYSAAGQQYWGVQAHGGYGVHEDSALVGVQAGNRDTIVHSYGENNDYSIWVQNQSVAVTNEDVSTSQYQIFTIANLTDYACHAKLYRCKCVQNSVLIRDFIPVQRNNDNTVGLLDMVNNVFYTNAGTGKFVAGYKTGYQLLEYIESSGTQYIDTGIPLSTVLGVKANLRSLNIGSLVDMFGTQDTSAMSYFTFGYNISSQLYAEWSGTGTVINASPSVPSDYDIEFNYQNSGTILVNGTNYGNISISGATSRNLYICADNLNGSATRFSQVQIKSFTITSEQTVIRDYVPCVSPTGKVGLYDKVTKRFYGNLGTGNFIAGPPLTTLPLYNRWTQTSSPKATTVSGFKAISTSWPQHNAGIRAGSGSALYNCDSGGTWYAPIGQFASWTDTQYIPAADGTSQTETELWVRTDRLEPENQFKVYDGSIAATNYIEI